MDGITTTFSLPEIDDNVPTVAAEDINTTAGLLTKKKPVKVISNDVNWESYAAVMYNTAKHCQSQRQVNVLNDQPKSSDDELRGISDANNMLKSYLEGNISSVEWYHC